MLEAEAVGSPTGEWVTLSNEAKTHLHEMAKLLSGDIGELVSDAKPVRAHFKALQGKIPESVEEALICVAHLEVYDSWF